MGSILEAIKPEDRMEIKYSDFHDLIMGCTKYEIMLNGVNCDVPYKYIREMMSGEKEPATTDQIDKFVDEFIEEK